MDMIGQWWNSSFGTMSRRDIFLRTQTVWEVETREGGSVGQSNIRRFASEADARAFVKQCLADPDDWRDLDVAAATPTTRPGLTPVSAVADSDMPRARSRSNA
jgi:hypothetical protein